MAISTWTGITGSFAGKLKSAGQIRCEWPACRRARRCHQVESISDIGDTENVKNLACVYMESGLLCRDKSLK